ncbi:hypothetical protein [Saccharopolyspora spinosa]|uniref:hypothetical protein n=1 Tax=Saccharopolyspora spinosa TaxID=60894 RepID=UPI00376EABF6
MRSGNGNRRKGTKRSRARKAVAARVAVLEALAERGPLTVEEAVELAELQPKVAQWQKQKEGLADWHRSRKAEADRVAVLEALAERGPLTVEQEAELAELQTKVAQRKQKQKERNASITGRERLLSIVLRCWRSWRSGGR